MCLDSFSFSMFSADFCIRISIDRSGIGLLGFQRSLCGRGLEGVTFVGVAIARYARWGHAHKGHALKATPTRALFL